jgi:hypothetical protein
MSWQENIQRGIVITTGDGREWTPLYMMTPLSYGFNIAEYNFPYIEGTKIDRYEAQGVRFELDLIFQGEDHLETKDQFIQSSKDKRPWTIQHPIHGIRTGHPLSLSFDSSGLNMTRITGTFAETIQDDAPRGSMSPIDTVLQESSNYSDESDGYAETSVDFATSDVQELSAQLNENYDIASERITPGDIANAYLQAFRTAQNAVLTATSDPLRVIRTFRTVLLAPASFRDSVQNRINLFREQFEQYRSTLVRVQTPEQKAVYEINAGTIISGAIISTVTPLDESDYQNAPQVLSIASQLVGIYNQYIEDLDSLQTDNGGTEDSYIPNYNTVSILNQMINIVSSELFDIALGAKQQRTILLEEGSDVINLTHRFYGLDENDLNLDEFMRNNNIGLNELLMIRKGRQITYYV